MALAKRLSTNFLVQAIGKALSVLAGLAGVAILTRALGTETFGEYTTAITFLQLFGVVVDFGLTLTLIVMISERGADERRVVGSILGLRIFSGAILFSMAPLAVLSFPWSSSVKLGVAIGSVAYLFMAAATILNGVFQKHAAMWRAALAELLNRLVLVAAFAAFAAFGLGMNWMIAAMVLANLVWLVLMIAFARPFVRIRPVIDTGVWKTTLSQSWPIGLSIIFNLIYLKADILFLAFYRTQTEVGYYGVAYKVLDVLTAIPVMFMGLLLPVLVKEWTGGDTARFRRHIRKTFDLFTIAAVPLVVGAQEVAGPLVALVAGSGYEPAGEVLRWLIVAVLGIFWGALYGHAIVALGKQKPMIWGYAAVAALSITGYLLFIPSYGMFGAAWVTVASELLIAGVTLTVVWRASGALPGAGVLSKALVAAAGMYGALRLLPTLPVLLDIAIAAAVYFLLMLAIRGIKPEDLRAVIPQRT